MIWRSAQYRQATRFIFGFLAGQVGVQILLAVTGLLLLRLMDVQSYAQFTIAIAFQQAVAIVVDVGFSNSIVALVGSRRNEDFIVASYVSAARRLRLSTMPVVVIASAPVFALLTAHHGWSVATRMGLFAGIAATVAGQGFIMYSAPLLIFGKVRTYYLAQIASSLLRLFAIIAFHVGSVLNGVTAVALTALWILTSGLLWYRASRTLIGRPNRAIVSHAYSDLIHYVGPLVPGIVFAAVQGQIGLFIISIAGSTNSVAEVGALGRLAQLFALLSAFNVVAVEPMVARTGPRKVKRLYLTIVGSAVVVGGVVTLLGARYPEPLLFLMGPRYEGLRPVIGLTVAGASMSYLGGVLWVMNNARRLIYWWYTAAYILVSIAVQLVAAKVLPMSTTRGILEFNLATNISIVAIHLAVGLSRLHTTGRTRQLISEDP